MPKSFYGITNNKSLGKGKGTQSPIDFAKTMHNFSFKKKQVDNNRKFAGDYIPQIDSSNPLSCHTPSAINVKNAG
jgi:archaellin